MSVWGGSFDDFCTKCILSSFPSILFSPFLVSSPFNYTPKAGPDAVIANKVVILEHWFATQRAHRTYDALMLSVGYGVFKLYTELKK